MCHGSAGSHNPRLRANADTTAGPATSIAGERSGSATKLDGGPSAKRVDQAVTRRVKS